ncbi:MAG: 5-methylthioadenosine/S-adenosylhomocysteine deaminase [Firmicutes bacterium]|nr:5-methylthioadenosine/S-adenosylhomocysteine deaminase [Bacillota bacterium]
MSILFKNALVVTMNERREVFTGQVYVEGNRIVEVNGNREEADKVVDATGQALIPGLIQPHIHLCQTIFRGCADDMELLDWLKLRIWPLEGAHDADSIYYSALLGCGELFQGGTTAIIDMETVHHTDSALQAITDCGMRAVAGKVMMDWGRSVPQTLLEDTDSSVRESVRLLERWHNTAGGRLHYAFSPRFVVSCTEELLVRVRDLSRHYGVMVHTHASENRGEISLVERERGMQNVRYLAHLGLTGPRLVLAHCIHVDDSELDILAASGTKVVHCPSSNLKLGSGIAPIPKMLEKAVDVSIAADGAPCNNNLDMFHEMRLAALIQKPIYGPTAMPAIKIFEMATLGGAKAMGLEDEIGSIEVGKKADLALVSLAGLHNSPAHAVDSYAQLVYQLKSNDVLLTMVDGRVVWEGGVLHSINSQEIKLQCQRAITQLSHRAGIRL